MQSTMRRVGLAFNGTMHKVRAVVEDVDRWASWAFAFCLALLACLMLDFVTVGLCEEGVDSAVPGLIRAEVLSDLELQMSPAAAQLAEQCYSAPDAQGVRTFEGDPMQLSRHSKLSCAFAMVAAGSGAHRGRLLEAGRQAVRAEYEALGLDLAHVRALYLRALTSQVVALAAALVPLRLMMHRSCRTRIALRMRRLGEVYFLH